MFAKTVRRRRHRRDRAGATVVEFAVVGPVVMLLLIGFAILTMGVFRYQQVAFLARQGARYAATHGAQYRVDNGLSVGDKTVWTADIQNNAILPSLASLDPANLTTNVSWTTGNNRANEADPSGGFSTTFKNRVTVTVTYAWFPEAFLVGPYNLTSTATMAMHY